MESAIALSERGAHVTLSYRGQELTRPKAENAAALRAHPVDIFLGSTVGRISEDAVVLQTRDGERTLKNDSVFALLGRDPPLSFFRKSGIPIVGAMRRGARLAFGAFLLCCVLLYPWKTGAIPSGLDGIPWQPPASLLGATVNATRDPVLPTRWPGRSPRGGPDCATCCRASCSGLVRAPTTRWPRRAG